MNEQPKPMTEIFAAAPKTELHVGRIVSVTGGHAIVLLDPDDNPLASPAVRGPEIGTLLKFDSHRSISLAMISGLNAPMPSYNPEDQELRIAEVEFIGELPKDAEGPPGTFRRGISFSLSPFISSSLLIYF